MSGARDTRFLLVGAGGLGGPLAYALAAADAKHIVLCDFDRVELSNLHRQLQFATEDVGSPKVDALAEELVRRGYPRTRLTLVRDPLTAANAHELIAECHVGIDTSDDFDTKFLINDVATELGTPFVIGSVVQYTGQVLANRPGVDAACYRCLFEAPPPAEHVTSCAEAGVLGAAVAVVAGHAARAALTLAVRRNTTEAGTCALLVFDDLRASVWPRSVPFNRRPTCPAHLDSPAPMVQQKAL